MEGAFWHKPDRGSDDYYRLVVDDEPRYDVWVTTEVTRKRHGALSVRVEVVLYDVVLRVEHDSSIVVSKAFDGYQPREQAFLMNVHTYEKKTKETVEKYCRWAERLCQ